MKYLFKGNAFRNEVENEEKDVEDSPVVADENDSEDESNDNALAKDAEGINLFSNYRILCDETLKAH